MANSFVENRDIGPKWEQESARKWTHKSKRASIQIKGNSPNYRVIYKLPSGRYVFKMDKDGSYRNQVLLDPSGNRIKRYRDRETNLMSPLNSAKLVAKTYMGNHQEASPPTNFPT